MSWKHKSRPYSFIRILSLNAKSDPMMCSIRSQWHSTLIMSVNLTEGQLFITEYFARKLCVTNSSSNSCVGITNNYVQKMHRDFRAQILLWPFLPGTTTKGWGKASDGIKGLLSVLPAGQKDWGCCRAHRKENFLSLLFLLKCCGYTMQ